MISMQKLNQLLVKKPVIAGEFLFIAIVGYFILGSSTDKPKATAPKQNIVYEKKENISEAKQIPIDFSKNPFGDISEFENSPGADGSFTGQLTRIPAIRRFLSHPCRREFRNQVRQHLWPLQLQRFQELLLPILEKI